MMKRLPILTTAEVNSNYMKVVLGRRRPPARFPQPVGHFEYTVTITKKWYPFDDEDTESDGPNT